MKHQDWRMVRKSNSLMVVWSNSHMDKYFNPEVKETYPTPWFAFDPNKLHKVWCRFSEAMDTGQNIRVSGKQDL